MSIASICTWLSSLGIAFFPALADVILKGVAILLLTLLVTIAMGRSSAAARYLVWFLGAACLLILPLLSAALPGLYILPGWATNRSIPAATTPAQPSPIQSTSPDLPALEPAVPDTKEDSLYVPPRLEPKLTAPPTTPVLRYSEEPDPQRVTVRLTWQGWTLLAWFTGIAIYLCYLLLACLSLWRIRRQSPRVTDPAWLTLLEQSKRTLNFHRPVELLSSRQRTVPMTWGLLQTRILVPGDSSHWTTEQRRAVLLHELAHTKRLDCQTQLLAHLACALHWFNPLIWFACRQMQAERERACDDLVLNTGTRASAYAEQLLQIATEMPSMRFSGAAIAMARPSKLEGRLLAILDVKRNRRALSWTAGIIALLIMATIATPLAMLRADNTLETPALSAVKRWAAAHGWSAQQVVPAELQSKWGGWRNLPFTLSPVEEAKVKMCIELSHKVNARVDGKTELSDPATRDTLQDVLKSLPNNFYAEFLLSGWFRKAGQIGKANALLESAYQHAPVIIVERFELPNGSPAANIAIVHFALECNRVQNGSLDPSLQLSYPDLETDADGCIYLPVYNTVYRTNEMSWPEGYITDFPTLGWFETSRKVGLLPVVKLTPKPGDFFAASNPVAPPVTTAALPNDNSAELLAVSDYPDPANTYWLPDGSPCSVKYTTGEPGISPWPAETGRRFVFRFSKALDADAHIKFRFSVPTTAQTHYITVRQQDLRHPYVLFSTFPTRPKRATLRLGEATGDWKVAAQYDPKKDTTDGDLPPGFVVTDDAGAGKEYSELTVAHPQCDLEIRVVRIDGDQREHPTLPSYFSNSDATEKDIFRLDRLPLANIHSFRIETREFKWADFSNIALEPLPTPMQKSGPPIGILPRDEKAPAHPAASQPATEPTVSIPKPTAATYRMRDSELHDVAIQVTTKGRVGRLELPNGTVLIMDNASGQALFLNPSRKTATILPFNDELKPFIQWESASMLKREIDAQVGSGVTTLPQKRIGDHMADGVRFKISAGGSMYEIRTVWRDSTTKIPVELESELHGYLKSGTTWDLDFDQIMFDAPVDDALVSPALPPGYTLASGDQAERPILDRNAASQPATQPAASILDFRIAAQIAKGDEKPAANIVSADQARQAIDAMELHGLQGTLKGFAWFETSSGLRSVIAKRDGKQYVLLATSDGLTMLTNRHGPRAWGLTQAGVAKDSDNRTDIEFTFDSNGGSRIGKLTESNLHRPLAFLIDDKVISVAIIESKITAGAEIVPGQSGFDPAVAGQIVDALSRGMPATPSQLVVKQEAGKSMSLYLRGNSVEMRMGDTFVDGDKLTIHAMGGRDYIAEADPVNNGGVKVSDGSNSVSSARIIIGTDGNATAEGGIFPMMQNAADRKANSPATVSTSRPTTQPDHVTMAEAVVDHMARGQFAEAAKPFSPVMAKLTGPTTLEEVWKLLEQAGGKYLGRGPARTASEQGYSVVYVPLRWEHNAVEMKVVIDGNEKITGLWTAAPPGTVKATTQGATAR